MGMTKSVFGKTSNGEVVHLVTVSNQKGMSIEVLDYGATLVSVNVPDKDGHTEDVALGYDDVLDYEKGDAYLGATVGRCGNRVDHAEFSLNGKEYFMEKNEGENVCHSGPRCYSRRMWDMELLEEENSVRFHLVSPNMDQGFPGTFEVTVTYTLTEENELKIHYNGTCDQDSLINMTNHSYFNLHGQDSGKTVEDHLVWIDADSFTPVREDLIPTGEIRSVEETPLDFRTAKELGKDIADPYEQMKIGSGYDHNFVLNHYNGKLRRVAEVKEPESGRVMEVFTDLPAMQVYSGNFLAGGPAGKNGAVYVKRSGLAMETQYCPDAIHHENFVSPILKAGEVYDTVTIYKFHAE